MIKIVVLTGAPGSGQTTVSYEIEKLKYIKRLKPYTTRPPRFSTEQEYYFVKQVPNESEVLWKIKRLGFEYGMLRSELEKLDAADVAVTVFDPLYLKELDQLRSKIPDLEIITIGLDTISTSAQQAQRVGQDQTRMIDQDQLQRIQQILESTDIKINGTQEQVTRAVKATCEIIMSRGGILTREQFVPLIEVGSLLVGALKSNVQTASYDLTVGDEVWCAGKVVDLTDQSPFFAIPPYSYVIIKAAELAIIPPFITAQFDIRVSHFLSGLILSNGPQVDPGYKGDLFCMIFNCNSSDRIIRKGDHFSTIQFLTTTRGGVPYEGYYRMRKKLTATIPPEVATGRGGVIIDHISDALKSLESRIDRRIPNDMSTTYLAMFAMASAFVLGLATLVGTTLTEVQKTHLDVQKALIELKSDKERADRAERAK